MSSPDLQAQIMERAMRDPEFRERLKTSPREALRDAFGIEMPDGIDLRVVEETSDSVFIVLPPSETDRPS